MCPQEYSSPIDIIRARRWDSATFTTFALSLSFFETMVLRELRQKECKEIYLIVDSNGYENSLMERQLSHVGQEYRIIPIALVNGGIFHAKCTYLSGPDGDVLMIGSGNLTFGGYGNNLEILSILTPEQHSGVFHAFGDFIQSLATAPRVNLPDSSWVEGLAKLAQKAPPEATGSRNWPLLIHSLDIAIVDQLKTMAEELGGCIQATILSPYFDGTRAVDNFSKTLECNDIRIVIPTCKTQLTQFPFAESIARGQAIQAVSGGILRGEGSRPFHAKLFELNCRKGRLVLIGSVNATSPALIDPRNVEVGLVYRYAQGTAPHRLHLDWTSANIPEQYSASASILSGPDRGFVLFAQIATNGNIKGRILGNGTLHGVWFACLSSGSRALVRISTDVDDLGNFTVPTSQLSDLTLTGALQLELRQDHRSARGWVNQEELIQQYRRHGAAFGAILRAVRGIEADEDLEAIFDWLLNQSTTGEHAFLRPTTVSSTDAPSSPTEEASRRIEADELGAHTVAEAAGERGKLGALPASAFDVLLTRLRSRLRTNTGKSITSSPTLESNASGENEGQDKGEEQDSGESGVRVRARRKQLHSLARFQDVLWEIAEERGGDITEEAYRSRLVQLLEASLYVYYQHPEDAYDRAFSFLSEWLRRVTRLASKSSEIDALDQSVITVTTILFFIPVAPGNSPKFSLHAVLERYAKGDVGANWALACLLPAKEIGNLALGMNATDDELKFRLIELLTRPTPRALAARAYEALSGEEKVLTSPELKNAVFAGEFVRLAALARPRRRIARVGADDLSCPKCSVRLASSALVDLRRDHVVCCTWCGTALFKIAP